MRKRDVISLLYKAEIIEFKQSEMWVLAELDGFGKLFIKREIGEDFDRVIVKKDGGNGDILLVLEGEDLASVPLKYRRKLGLPLPRQSKLDWFVR